MPPNVKIILHRINSIEKLLKTPHEYGVEIDIRGYGTKLFLSHDPIDDSKSYDELETYLGHFKHAFIIFNIKEAGYESRVIALAKKHGIKDYFLLDVEFPYLYEASRMKGVRDIAVRFSEAEPIEAVEAQIVNGKPLIDWVWIDTNTMLPLTKDIVKRLKPFKTCLVSPDRWGRPDDIASYRKQMEELDFSLDAVMTGEAYADAWMRTTN